MVIVYQSKTGFTQQYAELLGESELVEVLPLKEAEQKLPSGTPVLFLGPLSAGRIAGLKRARKAFLLQGVCGVGMSPPSPELTEKLRQDNQLGDLPVFYLQGGWAPDRVNPMTRAMVHLVTRSTRRALQAKGRTAPLRRMPCWICCSMVAALSPRTTCLLSRIGCPSSNFPLNFNRKEGTPCPNTDTAFRRPRPRTP